MDLRHVRLFIISLLFILHPTLQQSSSEKKKDGSNKAAIEELKKKVDDIVQELKLLKEQQALQTVCLKGIKIPGKCFLSYTTQKTFHAATAACTAIGGVLSTPLSGSENIKLHEYALLTIGPDEDIWLGINDMVTEGTWLDNGGNAFHYKNWDTEIPHEPNGGRSENCAVLSPASGTWLDESCQAERAFVCEFNIV